MGSIHRLWGWCLLLVLGACLVTPRFAFAFPDGEEETAAAEEPKEEAAETPAPAEHPEHPKAEPVTTPAPDAGGLISSVKAEGLSIGGQVMVRGESKANRGGAAGNVPFVRNRFRGDGQETDRDNFVVQRTWLTFDLKINPDTGAFVRLQDSRLWGRENAAANTPVGVNNGAGFVPGSTGSADGGDAQGIDVREAFVSFQNVADRDFSIKAGRQKAAFDNHRWIGTFDWNHIGRSYDGVRGAYTTDGKDITTNMFAFRVQEDTTNVIAPNGNGADAGLYGVHTKVDLQKMLKLDDLTLNASPFIFVNHNRNKSFQGEQDAADVGNTNGSLTSALYGFRLDGKGFDADWNFEGALNRGRLSSSNLRAYQLAGELGYTLSALGDLSPRLAFGYAQGSGDSNPGDKVAETPDMFFPTNHVLYGYMDLHSLRNLADYYAKFSVKPCQDITVGADLHWFRLLEDTDGWYNAGGTTLFGGNTPRTLQTLQAGVSSAHVSRQAGTELDLTANWQVNGNVSLEAGYSHYFPGAMLRDAKWALGSLTGNTTATHSHVVGSDFYYLQVSVDF